MENTSIHKAVPVVLPIDHWAELKDEGKETGRSASAIIRDLVAAHLRRKLLASRKMEEEVA